MTSTTSKWSVFIFWYHMALAVLFVASVGCIVGCDAPQSTVKTDGGLSHRTVSPQAEPQEPPKPSPASTSAPAEDQKDEKETPYYGSTYWDELLTSVYYYPENGGKDNAAVPATHLKFNHREDDVWVCGDQRKSFKPGHRVRLTVTFEANQPCATNWQIE